MGIINQLEQRRQELKMSRAILAQRSGVSLPTVNRILSGKHMSASFDNVLALADQLNMEIQAVERGRSHDVRQQQAEQKAKYLVSLVQGTSALEGQGLDEQELKELVDETAKELFLTERKLWAE